jgi:hypothetical protein
MVSPLACLGTALRCIPFPCLSLLADSFLERKECDLSGKGVGAANHSCRMPGVFGCECLSSFKPRHPASAIRAEGTARDRYMALLLFAKAVGLTISASYC